MAKNTKRTSVKGKSDSRKESSGYERRKEGPLASPFRLILFIVLILVGVAAIFAAISGKMPDFLGGASLSGKLAATVNGEKITMAELEDGYSRLPVQYQAFISKEVFLEQLVDQLLLRQDAVKKGVVVTKEEAEQNIKSFLQKNNISDEEFQKLLENKSLNYDELVQVSSDQLVLQKLIESEISSKIIITTEDALKYYNGNTDTFKNPEILTIRHILVASLVNNRSAEEADGRAKEAYSKLKADKGNFCDLVREYSDDVRSVDSCGQYDFPKGQMPLEFEEWAAKAKPGDTGLVKTLYGTHVLWLMNKTPESIIRFKDVQEQIMLALKSQEEKRAYQVFIAQLRQDAEIKNYLVSPPAVKEDVVNIDVPGGQAAGGTVPEEGDQVPEAAESAPADEPVQETASTETTVTIADDTKYIDCLASKGATLYGTSWDSGTKQQKALFSNGLGKIKYVECSVPGDYKTQSAACKAAGIQAYPAWKVGAQTFLGIYAPKQLADAVGC